MKTTRFFKGLRGKVLLTFLAIALIPLIIISLVSYFITQSALQRQATNQLISVREVKKSQIEDYFEFIRKQVLTMAENQVVIDAMRDFTEAFPEAAPSDISPETFREYEASLQAYYTDEYLPRLNANLETPASLSRYLPTDEATVIWQYHYISNNPNPVGQKDQLTAASQESAYSQLHGQYHPAFRSFLKEFGYYDIFLLDNDGQLVYTVFKETDYATNLLTGPYRDTNLARVFRAANDAGRRGFTQLVDFEPYAPSYQAPAAFIATPIYDGPEKIGVLAFQMPIDRINSIMTTDDNWQGVGLGSQGEVYLVGADNKMRSNSRLLAEETNSQFVATEVSDQMRKFNTTILLKEVRTEGTEAALRGVSGAGIFPSNYRGTTVLSAYAPLAVPDVQWAILAETTQAEAFGAVRQLIIIMLIASGLAALMVILISFVVATNLANPIVGITRTAVQVADGDLNVHVPSTNREDEIGVLAQTFTRMIDSFRGIANAAGQIASGDLGVKIPPRSEKDVLGQALAEMVANLRRQTQEVMEGVNVLATSVSEISTTISELATNTSETATAVTETSTTMEEVKQTAQLSSQKAEQVAELAQQTAQISQKGRQATARTVEGMNRIREQMDAIANSIVNLSEQSQAIGQIIATVNDLADQSNLLAVNAAIEAAKAGEQGKGFAVVAQEIKNLAEQSKRATAQVQVILNDIQKATASAVMTTEQGSKAVEAGVQQSIQAGEAIMGLASSVTEAAEAATQIAVSSQQQLVGTDQIVIALESIKQASLQNVEGTRQLEGAAHNLNGVGQKLKQLVELYRV